MLEWKSGEQELWIGEWASVVREAKTKRKKLREELLGLWDL
jgi:hypothetical protein